MFDAEEMRARASRARYLVAIAGLALLALPPTMLWAASRREGLGVLLLVFVVFAAVTVTTAVCWIQWFHAVYEQAERHGGARFPGPWWWLAWILPGASVVLPKMMVNDLWRAGAPGLRNGSLPGAVQTWWVLWATPGVVSLLTRGARGDSAVLAVISFVAFVASTPFAMRTVTLLTDHAVRLCHAERATMAGEPTPAHPGF